MLFFQVSHNRVGKHWASVDLFYADGLFVYILSNQFIGEYFYFCFVNRSQTHRKTNETNSRGSFTDLV